MKTAALIFALLATPAFAQADPHQAPAVIVVAEQDTSDEPAPPIDITITDEELAQVEANLQFAAEADAMFLAWLAEQAAIDAWLEEQQPE